MSKGYKRERERMSAEVNRVAELLNGDIKTDGISELQRKLAEAKQAELQTAQQDISAILDRVQGTMRCVHIFAGGQTQVTYEVVSR